MRMCHTIRKRSNGVVRSSAIIASLRKTCCVAKPLLTPAGSTFSLLDHGKVRL